MLALGYLGLVSLSSRTQADRMALLPSVKMKRRPTAVVQRHLCDAGVKQKKIWRDALCDSRFRAPGRYESARSIRHVNATEQLVSYHNYRSGYRRNHKATSLTYGPVPVQRVAANPTLVDASDPQTIFASVFCRAASVWKSPSQGRLRKKSHSAAAPRAANTTLGFRLITGESCDIPAACIRPISHGPLIWPAVSVAALTDLRRDRLTAALLTAPVI